VQDVTTDELPPWRAPYVPSLALSARALAAAALVAEAVEIGIGPHREISAIFVGVGLLVGYAVGRSLSAQLRGWAEDAPELSAWEASRVREARFAPLSLGALVIITLIAIGVPLATHLPTPLPGALAAGAVQAFMQARALRSIERERSGEVLRPVGQLSFEGTDLRLRYEGSVYADAPTGEPLMPG
jgi:hypothetical protein